MALIYFDRHVPPDPLPESLPSGTRTTLRENPYELVGEARLLDGVYRGYWLRKDDTQSSFVHPCLVNWKHWRLDHDLMLADGLRASDAAETRRLPPAPPRPYPERERWVLMPKCSCCDEREADLTFPGLTEQTRDLAGRPIAGQCFGELLAEGKGARDMAQRIRARDSVRKVTSFCAGTPV